MRNHRKGYVVNRKEVNIAWKTYYQTKVGETSERPTSKLTERFFCKFGGAHPGREASRWQISTRKIKLIKKWGSEKSESSRNTLSFILCPDYVQYSIFVRNEKLSTTLYRGRLVGKILVHLTVGWWGKSEWCWPAVADETHETHEMEMASSVALIIMYLLWSVVVSTMGKVTKCDANKYYTMCIKSLLDMHVRITGKTSVDNTKWVCLSYTLKKARETCLLWFVYEKASNDSF